MVMGRIVKLWPLILAIVFLITAFIKIDITVNALDKSVTNHHLKDDDRDNIIDKKVAVVEESQDDIKNRLIRIEHKIDGLR